MLFRIPLLRLVCLYITAGIVPEAPTEKIVMYVGKAIVLFSHRENWDTFSHRPDNQTFSLRPGSQTF
jgi:hypothetical protein